MKGRAPFRGDFLMAVLAGFVLENRGGTPGPGPWKRHALSPVWMLARDVGQCLTGDSQQRKNEQRGKPKTPFHGLMTLPVLRSSLSERETLGFPHINWGAEPFTLSLISLTSFEPMV